MPKPPLRGCFVNLLLVLASIGITIFLATTLDRLADRFVSSDVSPGAMGLLFPPNTVLEYAMEDYTTTERINALGIRDDEIALDKGRAFRIVAIGDSFTYGWGVNLEDAWCKVLEKKLRAAGWDVEIINLGKPAAGPDEYAFIAENIAPAFHPDLLLVGVLAGDDLQQLPNPLSSRWILRTFFPTFTRWTRTRAESGDPPPTSTTTAAESRERSMEVAQDVLSEMDAAARAHYAELPESVREAFLEGRLNPWMIGHTTGNPEYFMNTVDTANLRVNIWFMTQAFQRIRAAADRMGARALVLNIPEGFYVNREAHENVQRIGFRVVPEMLETSAPDEAVARACARADLPFATATPGFRDAMDTTGLYLALDRHFTPTGNELLAEIAVPMLEKILREAAAPRLDSPGAAVD